MLEFRFAPSAASTWRSSRLEPAERVPGEVVDGPEEWIGTTVDWELTQDGDYTIVLFKHEGWRSRSSSCTTAAPSGRSFLMSLKSLVETGDGRARTRDDVQISDWH